MPTDTQIDLLPASETDDTVPVVSVIIPLYCSGATLPACLGALAAQTFRAFEVILVDSSPSDAVRPVVAACFETARYLYSSTRLNSQEARLLGIGHARGGLLAITDPDVYPCPEWIETLVRAHRSTGAVVLGSIACHGRRRLDRAVHLCKFSMCLPGGPPRAVALGWSGNLLIRRDVLASVGGWPSGRVQADSQLTARLTAAGHRLWFEPAAVAFHDHEHVSVTGFLRERFTRGLEFGYMEGIGELPHGASGASPHFGAHAVWNLLVAAWRTAGRTLTVARAAQGAGMALDYLVMLPVVIVGLCAWYAGLAAGHRRAALSVARSRAGNETALAARQSRNASTHRGS